MEILKLIPDVAYETIGIIAGLIGCSVIGIQVITEYKQHHRSSLSYAFLFGWLGIYMFWAIYGIRYEALALFIPNTVASILQVAMIIVILQKNKKYPPQE